MHILQCLRGCLKWCFLTISTSCICSRPLRDIVWDICAHLSPMVHIKDSTKLTPLRCCAFPAVLRDLRRILPLAFHLITDTSSAQCCHEDAGVRAHLCSVVSHGASCERAWCGFLEHCSSIPGDHIARKRTVADCGLLGPCIADITISAQSKTKWQLQGARAGAQWKLSTNAGL